MKRQIMLWPGKNCVNCEHYRGKQCDAGLHGDHLSSEGCRITCKGFSHKEKAD